MCSLPKITTGIRGLDVGVEVAVEGVGGQGGDVADDYQFHSCAGHGHVHAPEVAKETYVAVVVAPYEEMSITSRSWP